MSGSLRGRTLLVTRAAGDAGAWTRAIETRGGCALELACISVQPLDDAPTIEALGAALGQADWLALTSVHGVEAVSRLHPAPLPEQLSIACVGAQTAAATRAQLGPVALLPEGGSGSSLARALATRLQARGDCEQLRVVAAGSDRAHPHLEERLTPLGVEVTRVPVYRTLPAAPLPERRELAQLGVDTVLLASPSAAEGLVNQTVVTPGIQVLCIGPSTAAAARDMGLTVTAEAAHPDLDSLLELIP